MTARTPRDDPESRVFNILTSQWSHFEGEVVLQTCRKTVPYSRESRSVLTFWTLLVPKKLQQKHSSNRTMMHNFLYPCV